MNFSGLKQAGAGNKTPHIKKPNEVRKIAKLGKA